MSAPSTLLPEAGDEAARCAASWYTRVAALQRATMPFEDELPSKPMAALAAFVALALAEGRTLMVLVPDDTTLPELSNALDLAIRPLCLVLPAADFATRIALRATLSLLQSRLRRDGEESRSPAWMRQRERLANHAALWREVQSWATRETPGAEPAAVAELFPVLILPLAAWRAMPHQSAEITLLYRVDAPPGLSVPFGSLLRVGSTAAPASGASPAQHSESTRLLLERAQLTQDISDLELELASIQAELAEFMRDYHQRVGNRMAEHDALLARIAGRNALRTPENPQLSEEARTRREQARQSAAESRRFAEAISDEAPVFRPDNDTKRLFRQIAQQIHPDRASNEADRIWRTQLMSEANRAYRHGDAKALREVAALWQEGRADAAAPVTLGVSILNLQVQGLRARMVQIEGELHRLFGSRLYELFIAARQAARQGRDLLAEMATQLDTATAELRRSGDFGEAGQRERQDGASRFQAERRPDSI